MRWETERSFDGKLCQEYSSQKLSKSDNWFLSYSRKCLGCFFWGHSVVVVVVVVIIVVVVKQNHAEWKDAGLGVQRQDPHLSGLSAIRMQPKPGLFLLPIPELSRHSI